MLETVGICPGLKSEDDLYGLRMWETIILPLSFFFGVINCQETVVDSKMGIIYPAYAGGTYLSDLKWITQGQG